MVQLVDARDDKPGMIDPSTITMSPFNYLGNLLISSGVAEESRSLLITLPGTQVLEQQSSLMLSRRPARGSHGEEHKSLLRGGRTSGHGATHFIALRKQPTLAVAFVIGHGSR